MARHNLMHDTSTVPGQKQPRSAFNLSHTHRTTLNEGNLVPILVKEVIPGDTFNIEINALARLATPIVPVMDDIYYDIQIWYCPNRLVWKNWMKFQGEREDPDDSIDFLVPQIESGESGFPIESLGDYMGIPPLIPNLSVNALPFRMYQLIWNEWYRSQDLQDSIKIERGDEPQPHTKYSLKKRGKRHDYFTSCLPFPQKGEEVRLPLGNDAPVYGNGKTLGLETFSGANTGLSLGSFVETSPRITNLYTSQDNYNKNLGYNPQAQADTYNLPLGVGVTQKGGESGLYADLREATAITVNNLRMSVQIQRLLERDARGGTRYAEILRSHWGVKPADASLQRPEYLGGSSNPIIIHPVIQMSETQKNSPQGNLAGFGVGSIKARCKRYFTEHGFIIALASVRAPATYQQGLHKKWSRRTRFDYYMPVLAHLGEAEVLNKEIYCQGTEEDDKVFGYNERWLEYRMGLNRNSGKFRSQIEGEEANSLDKWHLAQNFTSLPKLNSTFIIENPPIERIVAVPSEPHFLVDHAISIKTARVMPAYSVPGMMDHF